MGEEYTGHAELLHPSQYLKAADLFGKDGQPRDVHLTITRVERSEVSMAGGKTDTVPIIYFREARERAERTGEPEKRLICNVTNRRSIQALHGNIVGGWRGKRITLYATQCSGKEGKLVDCIRVRATVPPDPAPTPEPQPEPQDN